MASTVRNIKPESSVAEHLRLLFEGQSGWVYAPHMYRPTKSFYVKDTFFLWPDQAEDLHRHIIKKVQEEGHEVWVGPALYREKPPEGQGGRLENVKGSKVVWCDFDGAESLTNEEFLERGIPVPTWRVASSDTGHEHCYWLLDHFCEDIGELQEINKAIYNSFGAVDDSWAANKVLRPIGTFNFKRNSPVTLVRDNRKVQANYSLKDFAAVERVEEIFGVKDLDLSDIPDAQEVLLTFSFLPETIDLVLKDKIQVSQTRIKRSKKNPGTTGRSGALQRLAHDCVAVDHPRPMTNEEIFSVLLYKDTEWKKFYDRPPAKRDENYVKMISYARAKADHLGLEDIQLRAGNLVLDPWEAVRTAKPVVYLIDGMLAEENSMLVAARPGAGKTLWAHSLTVALATGTAFLGFKAESGEPTKVLFYHFEMSQSDVSKQHMETSLKYIDENMDEEFRELMKENYKLVFIEEGVGFWDKVWLGRFIHDVETHKPSIVVIDTSSLALSKHSKNYEEAEEVFLLLRRLQRKLHFAIIFCSHIRKNDVSKNGSVRIIESDDIFGNDTLARLSSGILGLTKMPETGSDTIVTLKYLKVRFGAASDSFMIKLNPETMMFEHLIDGGSGLVNSGSSSGMMGGFKDDNASGNGNGRPSSGSGEGFRHF